jgi:hypothetical protein
MMTFLLLLGGFWLGVISVAILAFAAAAHRHQPIPELSLAIPHRRRLAPARCDRNFRHRPGAVYNH